MRIAFISYEHPPETATGGIGTYVAQASRMLGDHGHEVEVFTATPGPDRTARDGNVIIHRISIDDRRDFAMRIAPAFRARHAAAPFDVLEGPDCFAEAAVAARLAPDLPLVVKLHTGMCLIQRLNLSILPARQRLRKRLGALRRRQTPLWRPNHSAHVDEAVHVRQADEIAAPSPSIARLSAACWGLDVRKISVFPYPFRPPRPLLEISGESSADTILFLGRLEIRKGVIDLVDAIPHLLAARPATKVRFVGASLDSPEPGMDMKSFLIRRLGPHAAAASFEPPIAHDRLHEVFAPCNVCVIPSLWENFPNVCLEAMSAARAIVATLGGGMEQQLDGGRCGLLVPPRNPRALAAAILALLADERRRAQLGRLARQRVLSEYDPARIAPLQIASYERAIARRRQALGQSCVAG